MANLPTMQVPGGDANSLRDVPGQIACSYAQLTANFATFNGTIERHPATSTTSVTMPGSFPATITVNIGAGLGLYFQVGWPVSLLGNPQTNNYFVGSITSYNNTTGDLVTSMTNGFMLVDPYASWDVLISTVLGVPGSRPILTMSSLTGGPATVGNQLIGSGVTSGTYLSHVGAGSFITAAIVSSQDIITTPTAMTLTKVDTEIVCIQSQGWSQLSVPPFHGFTNTPKFTDNAGATWIDCINLPAGPYHAGGLQAYGQTLVADHSAANTMYAFFPTSTYFGTGGTYRSVDGGRNWTVRSTFSPFPAYQENFLYSAPGVAGDLWLYASGSSGLYRSVNGGTSYSAIANVAQVYLLSIGKQKAGTSYPCIAMLGVVSSVSGWYYSTDAGANWIAFNGDVPSAKSFSGVANMHADLNIAGRFYFNTFPCGGNWIQLF